MDEKVAERLDAWWASLGETAQNELPDQVDAEQYDQEHVRHLEENRPLVNDQPASGDQGISSDKPGVDGGGYPEEPPARR